MSITNTRRWGEGIVTGVATIYYPICQFPTKKLQNMQRNRKKKQSMKIVLGEAQIVNLIKNLNWLYKYVQRTKGNHA